MQCMKKGTYWYHPATTWNPIFSCLAHIETIVFLQIERFI